MSSIARAGPWRECLLGSIGLLVAAAPLHAAEPAGAAAAVERWLAAAEAGLAAGETQIAESHYRSAVAEGFMALGSLEAAEGRLEQARDDFRGATLSTADARQATQLLVMAQLELGDAKEAVTLMTHLATRNAKDTGIRRLLAQALIVAGRPGEALQELEDAHSDVPDDLETLYALAAGYLRAKKVDRAQQLFAELLRRRPIAASHVLIGRTYRDYGEFELARAELHAALRLDPRARRAHYYLGMVAAIEDLASLDVAIEEFQEELKLAPDDPATNLSLGLALVIARRYAEALAPLEKAAAAQPPQPSAFHFLGRCLVALERPAEAKPILERALAFAQASGREDSRLRNIHYQLGLALRALGDEAAAAGHFAEAQRLTALLADDARESLDRYLRDEAAPAPPSGAPIHDTSSFAALSDAERKDLRDRLETAVARASFNLGVLQTQAGRAAQAAAEFERTAAIRPDFPRVQYSLGVSWFNAQEPRKAAPALARALAATPDDQNLRRMLALAWLDSEAPEKAVALLADDPGRSREPSLQYAYAVALVRAGRAAEAQPVFGRLIGEHGDTAELHVLVGQAHAQQGDYKSAVESLQRALALKPDVAEASSALGMIYLEQGKLDEAEQALRQELESRPADTTAQHRLAAVLELQGRPDEALALLRQVLRARPDFAQGRYLFGKILLAQGAAGEAAEQLEAALRVAPQDANIHYQLGRAYQQLGREEDARREFEAFQRIKDARPGPS